MGLLLGWLTWGIACAPAAAQSQETAAGLACPPTAQLPTSAQIKAAQGQARDRGYLWRMRKDGRDSWLFGTIHLGKLEWVFQGTVVQQAFSGSDTLAIELDLTDPAVLAEVQRLSNRPLRESRSASGSAVESVSADLVLPVELAARLDRLRAAACLPIAPFATLHPVMQAMTLTVMSARPDGLDPGYAQEFILGGLAKSLKKPVVSLETAAMQMSLLTPERPEDSVTAVEQMVQQLEQGKARPALLRMARAWEASDLRTIETYAEWCDCIHTDADRALLARMNDARNPGMAERIDALHVKGQRVFVAVGSLHMTGPNGLPALMRARGYAVERVRYPSAR